MIPTGNVFAATPVDLKLGALGRVIVALFRPEKETSNFAGWVLIPTPAESSTSYKKVVLPAEDVINGRFDVDVKSIFGADVDADGTPELCVLASYYAYGTAEEPDVWTDCFRWTGDRFDLVAGCGEASLHLKTAKAVRARFAKHPLKSRIESSSAKAPKTVGR